MSELNTSTTITVPITKVVGIVLFISMLVGLWYDVKSLTKQNESNILDLRRITETHATRLNQQDINIVEVKTKLDNIQAILVEIKNNIK